MSSDFCRGGHRVWGRVTCRHSDCEPCRAMFTTELSEGSETDRDALMAHVAQADTAHGQPREER